MAEALALEEGNAPQTEIAQNQERLAAATKRARVFKDAYGIIADAPKEKVRVPVTDLPLFQLKNNIRDKSREVFNSVQDFLTKFEIIVGHHHGKAEEFWETTLPLTVSSEQLSWFQHEFSGKGLAWSYVKAALQDKYGGANQAAYLSEQLHEMKLRPREDVIKYADHFTKLMRDAQEEDGKTWGQIFVRSLTADLQVGIKMTQSASGNKSPLTVARATELLAGIYDGVKSGEESGPGSFERSNGGSEPSSSARAPKRQRKESTMHDQCKRHPNAKHTNRECFSLKAEASSSSTSKDKGKGRAQPPAPQEATEETHCRFCGRFHVPGHCCKEYFEYKEGQQALRHRQATITTTTTADAAASSSSSTPPSTTAESEQVVDLQPVTDMDWDKELDKLNQGKSRRLYMRAGLTRSTNAQSANDLIFVPMYVQSSKVLGLVDSGANFSAFSKQFCQKNKISIIRQSLPIHEAAKGHVATSEGITDLIEVTHNGIAVKYRFHVLEMSNDTEVSIGLDLMGKIGIYLGGLAHSWDSR